MKFLSLAAVVLALAGVSTATSANNLLINGGFERAPAGNTILNGEDTSITGWTTKNQGVEWFTPADFGGEAPEGVSVVDLAWFMSSGSPGGAIEQTVATTGGEAYTLTFKGGTSTASGRDGTGIIDLWINGSLAQSFNLANPSAAYPASSYQSFSYGFVGAGASTTVRFANTQNAFQHFAFLDDASLDLTSTSVPEPATWALMMIGFGAAGTMLRRRNGGARYRLVEDLGEGDITSEDFDAPCDETALRRVASVTTGPFQLWRGDVLVHG